MRRRLFLADPSLVDLAGHHFETTMGLARAAVGAFDETVILGHRRRIPALAAQGVQPVFTDSLYDPRPPKVWLPAEAAALEAPVTRPAADLLAALATWRIGPRDRVYFHTLTPNLAADLLEAACCLAPGAAPVLGLMLRYDPEAEPWVGSFARLAAALEAADRHGQGAALRLAAETDRLAARSAAALGRPVETVLHFPTAGAAPPAAAPEGPVTLGFLGEGRAEKGFAAFVAAAEALAAEGPPFRLVAQAYSAAEDPAFAGAAARLEALAAAQGGACHGVLEAGGFAAALAEIEVLALPHRPPAYARRGSGLFVDALASGAVAVVRAGTWMSGFDGHPGVVVFEDDASLAAGLAAGLALARQSPRAARAAAGAALFSASRHIEMLAAPRALPAPEERTDMAQARPTALVITKFWPKTGAAHVFRSQVAMLLAAGFDVSVATVTSFAAPEGASPESYDWHRAAMELPPVTFHWVCFAHPEALASLDEIAHGMTGTETSWTAETLKALATEWPASLARAMAETPPDLILCNYLSHLPLADRLKGPETRVVVETHDICSVQYATTADRDLRPEDYRAELSAGRRADGLAFISGREARAFDAAGIDTPAIQVLPGGTRELDPAWCTGLMTALAETDRAATVAGTQDMLTRLIGTGDNPTGAARVGVALRRAGPAGKFLVYVGSDHDWNTRGLAAFLDTAFLPVLQPAGFTLLVVGGVCDWLAETRGDLPGVIPAGILPDLRPIYELSAIVVLPVVGGTGFPIKTIDALANGLPTVGTPLAFRGLDPTDYGARVADIEGMAAEILDLAAGAAPDPAPRPAPALSFRGYCQTWAEFLSQILDRPITVPSSALPAPPPLEVAPRVAEILGASAPRLTALPAGAYAVGPETLPALKLASFGFQPRASEPDWLWSSSWYAGLLLAAEWRGRDLGLSLANVALPDWAEALDIDAFVDGVPERLRLSRQSSVLTVPLPEAGEGPILVELLLPEAVAVPEDDSRVLALCVTEVAPMAAKAPLHLARADFAGLDNPAFVDFAYQRILGKPADEGGKGHYLYELSQGVTRDAILETLAASEASLWPHGVVIA